MASPYRVAFRTEPAFAPLVRRRALGALARKTLAVEGAASPAQVGLVITNDETVRGLNRRHRGVDAPTDVLSFALAQDDGFVTPPESVRHLGEVVISYPTAERQATQAGHDVEDELRHLLVHGILHLLGYDHESANGQRAMRTREEAILDRKAH